MINFRSFDAENATHYYSKDSILKRLWWRQNVDDVEKYYLFISDFHVKLTLKRGPERPTILVRTS